LSVNDDNDQAKTFKNNNQTYLLTWEKKGRKCKIKDMIDPFNRNEKRKKERKRKDKKKVSVTSVANHGAPLVHLPVPWCFFAAMHHDDVGLGAQTHDVYLPGTRYP